ncbi:hypothetical protein VIBHAR_06285 [Vibrio campbellii ATCC BAA-1116]|uniref:Uncharacterized protein n=1 Tax=Vibrio campbellii (strain ATCC BAA-1116) TaxID=2902295 RepID=A7N6I4_VIBC1|nr:hypothetical protein VIBHAR_06285 [Vibrio campbellii ATCC BAA-1116]
MSRHFCLTTTNQCISEVPQSRVKRCKKKDKWQTFSSNR